MTNLHERLLPTSAGVEPATSWSPVGRRIQLSHRGRYTAELRRYNVLEVVYKDNIPDNSLNTLSMLEKEFTYHTFWFQPHRQETYLLTCAQNEDSDHSRSLVKIFTVRILDSQVCKVALCRQRRLLPGCADAQADLSLRWMHVRRSVFSCCSSFYFIGKVHVMHNWEKGPYDIGE